MGEEHGEGQQVGGDQVLGPQLYQPDTECGICHILLLIYVSKSSRAPTLSLSYKMWSV